MTRSFVEGTWQKERAFSPAVISEGGKTIYVAGHGGQIGADGQSLAGDFEAQTRRCFALMEDTLKEAGATLKDMVTMTVFILDVRHGDTFTALRREIFGTDFPASAMITVTGFAQPDMMVEIQGIAVLGDR
jgi:enamine deaminase RidA (YjgF/YER057c/UK114 family)